MEKSSHAFSLIKLNSTPTQSTPPSVPTQQSLAPTHDNRALSTLLLVAAVVTAIGVPLHLLQPEISPGSHTVRLILHVFNCLAMLAGYLLTRRGYGRFGLPLMIASWLVTVYAETLILQGSDHFQLLFAMILPVFVATIFRGSRYALVVAAFGLSAMLSLPFVMNSVSLQDILGPTLLLCIATVMAVASARAGRDYEASRRLRLTESEERYRALFNSVSDILFTISPTGELMQANPAIERELGWQTGELIGQNIGSYMHPEDMERARALFKSAIAEGTALPVFEARMRTRSGEYAWFEFTCTLHMHQG